mmetsp:Transcript_41502/g.106155  ORF Transcript_41502/g.106155 Transcript_41502/m.106155 type:complete len:442 (-) Transcript_41502:452-1777(-)
MGTAASWLRSWGCEHSRHHVLLGLVSEPHFGGQGDAQALHALGKLLQADLPVAVRVEAVEKVLDEPHVDRLHVHLVVDQRGAEELVADRLARELLAGLLGVGGVRGALHLPCLPAVQALRHRVDELLGGEALRAAEVFGAAAGGHQVVADLAHDAGELHKLAVGTAREALGVLHGANHGLHHAQRVQAGLLAAQVSLPHVRDGAVAGLKLLDHGAVLCLADEVAGDEAGRAVHLGNLVSEHVAIVVVGRHPEAAVRPTDDLHCRGVADEMLQGAAAALQQAGSLKLGLVVAVKDLLHGDPEGLLPLEHRLLGHHVGRDTHLQAASEEVVREVGHVVERVVVGDSHRLVVAHVAVVHNDDLRLGVLGSEHCRQTALAHCLPARAILAADSVALKEDGLVKAELDALDVDGVAADGDAVPAAAHRAVGAAPCLLEAKLLLLLG